MTVPEIKMTMDVSNNKNNKKYIINIKTIAIAMKGLTIMIIILVIVIIVIMLLIVIIIMLLLIS